MQNHSDTDLCLATTRSNNFPANIFTIEQLQHGAVLIHVFASMYIFSAMAYLCDMYFVPSVERIAEKLKLSPDVAGATFMAIGASSPELFTSLIGVFVAQDDVGFGTIVGSAIFNIFFVIACCILVAPISLNVKVFPIMRDSLCYVIALVPVAIACLARKVEWYISLVMVIMYAGYVLIIYFSDKIHYRWESLLPTPKKQTLVSDSLPILQVNGNCDAMEDNDNTPIREALNKHTYHDEHQKHNGTFYASTEGNDCEASHNSLTVSTHLPFQSSNRHEISHVEFIVPESKVGRVMWILGLPVICLFWLTLPNPTNGKYASLYPLTFFISLFYIAGLSYMMVWMVTVIGITAGVPDIVMGLLVIAAGSSVPDALASIIVARQGLGSMAVSNCIGSNVFDILLCLGLPWLIKTTMTDYGSVVPIISNTIKFTIFVLMGSVLVMLAVFTASKWRLQTKAGIALLLLYVGFITVSILLEMNVFGEFNGQTC